MLSDLKYVTDSGIWKDKDGIVWEDKKDYLQIAILGFCGCGNPDEVMKYVYDMLKRVADITIDKGIEFEYSDLPSMFFLYWADKNNFIEHGTTIRCSWLTDLGKQLMADIEELQRS